MSVFDLVSAVRPVTDSTIRNALKEPAAAGGGRYDQDAKDGDERRLGQSDRRGVRGHRLFAGRKWGPGGNVTTHHGLIHADRQGFAESRPGDLADMGS